MQKDDEFERLVTQIKGHFLSNRRKSGAYERDIEIQISNKLYILTAGELHFIVLRMQQSEGKKVEYKFHINVSEQDLAHFILDNRRTSNELSLLTMAVPLVSAVFTMYIHLRESRANHNERVAKKRKINLGERRQGAMNLLDRAQTIAKTGAYPAAAKLLDQAIKEWQQEVNDNTTEKESDFCLLNIR